MNKQKKSDWIPKRNMQIFENYILPSRYILFKKIQNKTHRITLDFNKMLLHFRNPRSAAIPRKLIIAKEKLNYHHQQEQKTSNEENENRFSFQIKGR